MKEKDKSNCILIGLPFSGKSTFIAALWHVIESGELDESLTITGLPDDREYLNELRDSWQSCIQVERTKTEFKHKIELNVTSEALLKEIEFKFPDVSGEMYLNQFESRKLDIEFYKMIESSNSIILFINPQTLKEPISINDVNPCFEEDLLEEKNEYKIWEHTDAPTQVILVDLLQMIMFNTSHKINIAVIISAWDVIKERNITPSIWVKESLPLLFQFLSTNDLRFNKTFFGISAQGGKYSEDKKNLLNITPSQRIIVQTDSELTKDISLPIKWLLRNE